MAQLNPNFEIDFDDINSYEQIQLINDTQLAKENLLMHRAYKEPSDDEIIKNRYSSFTFVDFIPKLFTPNQQQEAPPSSPSQINQSKSLRYLELETFSDLFDRINIWLKLNRDWRVVSMETLVYDCGSQFNLTKSSIYANQLPRNTRGLRLFLSPSKSRFSGHQRIGCINVVPRKISGSYSKPDQEPIVYETLDQILERLNELLLTRPIEGRILSVETITLPMIDGYVDTESSYFLDARLSLLDEYTYGIAASYHTSGRESPKASGSGRRASGQLGHQIRSHQLIDILRVYYEFGPASCGLVNLIDFIPRFYSPTTKINVSSTTDSSEPSRSGSPSTSRGQDQQQVGCTYESTPEISQAQSTEDTTAPEPIAQTLMNINSTKIAATESLTRLIQRSLSWFDVERKRLLSPGSDDINQSQLEDGQQTTAVDFSEPVNLKLCNVQIHSKLLLKNELIQAGSCDSTLDLIDSRSMAHQPAILRPPITCSQCSLSTATTSPQDWCSHLIDLSQTYRLKFVRLAYVVPIDSRHVRSVCPIRLFRISKSRRQRHDSNDDSSHSRRRTISTASDSQEVTQDQAECLSRYSTSVSSSSSDSFNSLASSSDRAVFVIDHDKESSIASPEPPCLSSHGSDDNHVCFDDFSDRTEGQSTARLDKKTANSLIEAEDGEKARQHALNLVKGTNSRHRIHEDEHQRAGQRSEGCTGSSSDSSIGQLTYRLFAPCQLVNSSSCFSINPVNSSSPLARRGSVDLINGGSATGGLSSENASSSTSLLVGTPSNKTDVPHQVITSFGAFFPAISHNFIANSEHLNAKTNQNSSGNKFTTNEFEAVEAIRRRMEVYVTTNHMKVVAGETLIVNLSDSLSCLSTAIEQTVTEAPLSPSRPSTWVSVYVLYAAIEEPLLPNQLLAQQRLRDLELINEEEANCGGESQPEVQRADGQADAQTADGNSEKNLEQEAEEVFNDNFFDDDFRGAATNTAVTLKDEHQTREESSPQQDSTGEDSLHEDMAQEHGARPGSSAATIYNTAYDRTVPLPVPPDQNLSSCLKPVDFLGSQADCLWLNEHDLFEAHQGQLQMANLTKRTTKSDRREGRKRKSKRRSEDSQCSIM